MSVAEVETLPPPVELLPQIPALPMKRLNGLLEPGPRLLLRPDESPLKIGEEVVLATDDIL